MIECRCMGVSAIATAKSKQEARMLAAEKVLSSLLPKPTPTQNKKEGKKAKKPEGSSNDKKAKAPSVKKSRKPQSKPKSRGKK